MIEKKRMAKFIAFVLTLCMVMSMSPVVTFASTKETSVQDEEQLQVTEEAQTPAEYYSPVYKTAGEPVSGLKEMEKKSCDTYTRVTTPVIKLTSGWYVFSGYVKRDKSLVKDYYITILGDVNIILEDGCEFQVDSISVPESSSLTIYGQSGNTGQLKVLGSEYDNASIGGSIAEGHTRDNGPITINGGTVTARSVNEGAVIGGAISGNGKNITINGGKVTANSNGSGTAIGGGGEKNGGNGTDIIINGGTVRAESDHNPEIGFIDYSAVIGGAANADGKNITINGGDVTAETWDTGCGAGIGGGVSGYGTNINILGGTVKAIGGSDGGAGIGGGEDRDGIDITIKGGTVNASGGLDGGAGIGGGEGGSADNITIEGGDVTAIGKGGGAAIGGGEHFNGGGSATNINIKGGLIKAYGRAQASGIGGGADGGTVNNINITGGDVKAYGDQEGAGIGGGKKSEAYNITVSGRGTKVYAQGGVSGGAGIGGARNRTGADIHIEDGATVTARSFSKSPNPSAIGGGSDGDSKRIYIYKDSVVKADNSYLPQTLVPNVGGEIQYYLNKRLNCTVVPKDAEHIDDPGEHSGSWEGFIATGTASKTQNVITWNKVADAAGYDVYFARCDKKPKKIASVEGLKYIKKNLNPKRNYMYIIKAYTTADGAKEYIAQTPLIHVAGSKAKCSNATKVTAAPDGIQVKAGKTRALKVKITKKSGNKKLIWKGHTASKIRYMSTDKYVAIVNSKGKIKAANEGIAYVYAYTANGAFARVTVIVE